MNTLRCLGHSSFVIPHSLLSLALLLPAAMSAAAVTFTTDTAISFNNTNYDGLDIAVTNCTLTVDGAHSFASLQVLNGGTVTHTYSPGGLLYDWRAVTNEPHVLSATNAATLSNANVDVFSVVVQDFAGVMTYTNGADYVIGSATNRMTTLLLTTNSAIADGSTNLVSYRFAAGSLAAGLSLTVTGDVTVAVGGTINADGRGYAGGAGPGAGTSSGSPLSGSGAGYGGYGGQSAALDGTGQAYGVLQQPAALGSGGGTGSGGVGGAGGGSIKLMVGGTMRVDGIVSANGANGLNERSGGGSGGSIWLSAQSLAGSGLLSANGGTGEPSQGGGGGGGRIALWYGANWFAGTMSAQGGSGYVRGGAGTIYTRASSQPAGQALVDNGGRTGAGTVLNASPVEFFDLTVQGGAVVSLSTTQWLGNLLVASNASISVPGYGSPAVSLTVTNNATVQAGGSIGADAMGNPSGVGQGAGGAVSTSVGCVAGGGGYGGYGAVGGAPVGYSAYGGSTYGSVAAPIDLGSGGGQYLPYCISGAGGGAIQLNVAGMLLLDGRISADGNAGVTEGGGGGSGGSIWLTVGTLAGAGTISANGGMGFGVGLGGGGGGGGGRIAVLYGMNLFFGTTTAQGGAGAAIGGAGTVYTKGNSQTYGQVLVDNGNQSGTNTTFGAASLGTVDLTVGGGAVLVPPSSQSLGNLLVASNGWVSLTNHTLSIRGNATIQAGAGMIADGTGYAAGQGPGAGGSYSSGSGYVGGGGGYGGYGAAGDSVAGYSAYGGTTYGSATPGDYGLVLGGPGSGGGGASTNGIAGGAGGGRISLYVSGTLEVDGRISARGLPGSGPSAGGGSGGSITLGTYGTLSGNGIICADGGAGNTLGGGGGGGRILVGYRTNTFSGRMSAYGGGGYAVGGAGTICPFGTGTTPPPGPVVIDNGGQVGTNTGWPSGGFGNLTVSNGAWLTMPSSSSHIGNLVLGSNGWIYVSGSAGISGPMLTVNSNATIQAGGGIIADGGGYSYFNGGTGQGSGGYASTSGGYVGSGGGFGGFGGASGGSPSVAGGKATGGVDLGIYGGAGSAGGTYKTNFLGGPGGGAIRLYVTGRLQVDGRVSSSGGAGINSNAGGGSGGGIALTVGTLAGSGVIAANGGAANGLGGGGGGGRIAITYKSLAFAGLISAYGGGGYTRGGAGTIYTTSNSSSSWGQVLADNGGQAGANTSWYPSGGFDLTVTGGAVVALLNPLYVANLLVTSNAWLSAGYPVLLKVYTNATIQAGGGIVADGTGYALGTGPGAGAFVSTPIGWVGGGGGYGGCGAAGGAPVGYSAYGGSAYASVTAPAAWGSGGGAFTNAGTVPGSAGGGAIQMNVGGLLLANGRISANGAAGVSQGAGGGAGGSVWLTAGTLAGTGTISANGGAGNQLGGGGGGGCVSLQYGVNAFGGVVSACGGGGYAWGGAGTIYSKANSQTTGQVLVDNSGNSGANTPVPYLAPFDLTIRGGAIACPSGPPLLLNNLFLNSGGALTCLATQTNLDVSVLGNATIDSNSVMAVDGKGFGAGSGPGAGLLSNYIGSGAGYGGNGGASSLSPGGGTYGSAQQPVDRGSGGGSSVGAGGGSEGGGAIRLTVGGTLILNGRLSAEGDAGLLDDSGGGSGGSIWLSAGALTGTGALAAVGGAGELYNGGGGSGGRIAIYTPVDVFSGLVSVAGGTGFSPGQTGSVYYAASPAAPQVVSFTPVGVLTAAVSSADIVFSTPMNPYSVAAPNIGLTAPGGLAVSNLTATAISPYEFQITFPAQTAAGNYALTAGPRVVDVLGQPLPQVYTGTFSIGWAVVQGAVSDTNGLPVPGVLLQPDGAAPATTTDRNGNYMLGVPPAGTVHVVPSKAGLVFIPSSRAYTNVIIPITNDNYVAVSTVAPSLAALVQTNNFIMNWYGLSGVSYVALYSGNLSNWAVWSFAMPGTNGPMQLIVPLSAGRKMFFRLEATY